MGTSIAEPDSTGRVAPGSTGRARRALIVLGIVALAGAAFLIEAPLCPSAAVLGIPCPGCGLTRATLALLRGELRVALAFHPLVLVLAPLYFGALGAAAITYVRGPRPTSAPRSWLNGRVVTLLAWVLLVLVLGVWIARFFGAFGGPVPVRTIAPWARTVTR